MTKELLSRNEQLVADTTTGKPHEFLDLTSFRSDRTEAV